MENNKSQKEAGQHKNMHESKHKNITTKSNFLQGMLWMSVSLILILVSYFFNSGRSAKIVLFAGFLFGLYQFISGLSKIKK